jgi:hypothetical protein
VRGNYSFNVILNLNIPKTFMLNGSELSFYSLVLHLFGVEVRV